MLLNALYILTHLVLIKSFWNKNGFTQFTDEENEAVRLRDLLKVVQIESERARIWTQEKVGRMEPRSESRKPNSMMALGFISTRPDSRACMLNYVQQRTLNK